MADRDILDAVDTCGRVERALRRTYARLLALTIIAPFDCHPPPQMGWGFCAGLPEARSACQ